MFLGYVWTLSLTASTLLALVATLGYFVGRVRPNFLARLRPKSRQEFQRALSVAQELETITLRLRKAIRAHGPEVARFNNRLRRLERDGIADWHELYDQADLFLKPALRLGTELSHAYAELLQQMTHLSTFAELRTDPLTGISNRRALEDSLEVLLSRQQRYQAPLSVAMLDIDYFKRINDERGHVQGDRALQDLAAVLRANVRDCDALARYGGEEFVIVMPYTDLASATCFAERLRQTVEQSKLGLTISLGLAEWCNTDTNKSLIGRADAALYAAKRDGRNCVRFQTHKAKLTSESIPTTPSRMVEDVEHPLAGPEAGSEAAASDPMAPERQGALAH